MDPLLALHQQVGQLEGKISAAHSRLDRHESVVQRDLTEIKSDLKTVMAFMNTSKGWGAGALFVSGIVGTIAGIIMSMLLR